MANLIARDLLPQLPPASERENLVFFNEANTKLSKMNWMNCPKEEIEHFVRRKAMSSNKYKLQMSREEEGLMKGVLNDGNENTVWYNRNYSDTGFQENLQNLCLALKYER